MRTGTGRDREIVSFAGAGVVACRFLVLISISLNLLRDCLGVPFGNKQTDVAREWSGVDGTGWEWNGQSRVQMFEEYFVENIFIPQKNNRKDVSFHTTGFGHKSFYVINLDPVSVNCFVYFCCIFLITQSDFGLFSAIETDSKTRTNSKCKYDHSPRFPYEEAVICCCVFLLWNLELPFWFE